MKKIIATTTGLTSPLAAALPAYATSINTCPSGLGGTICSLQAGQFGPIVGQVIQLLIVIAIVIAVFFLVWGGIKWILSGGDKAKVESARNTIIGAIVGLILVFLAFFIISVVANLFGINITNIQLPKIGA